jgi:VIT1/CCC1 family predicted Fe2+/Mn2+ transporter
MALPIFAQKIKKTITKYFPSPAWPWEIVSGLFIVLIMTNGLTLFSKDSLSINRTFFVFVIVAVNLLWGIFDGLMLIFTNLLEEGRYNKMISRIKSSDKKLATELIKNELGDTIINRCDKETREQLIETVLNNFSSTPSAIFKKPKISQNDIIAALICTFFVFLPCIVILPFFLLINNLTLAILVSNIISLGMLFAFGYKLGSCTDRNKIITGMIIMLIGLVIIIAAIAFEIY